MGCWKLVVQPGRPRGAGLRIDRHAAHDEAGQLPAAAGARARLRHQLLPMPSCPARFAVPCMHPWPARSASIPALWRRLVHGPIQEQVRAAHKVLSRPCCVLLMPPPCRCRYLVLHLAWRDTKLEANTSEGGTGIGCGATAAVRRLCPWRGAPGRMACDGAHARGIHRPPSPCPTGEGDLLKAFREAIRNSLGDKGLEKVQAGLSGVDAGCRAALQPAPASCSWSTHPPAPPKGELLPPTPPAVRWFSAFSSVAVVRCSRSGQPQCLAAISRLSNITYRPVTIHLLRHTGELPQRPAPAP
jgi:RNase P/RNase MRP subunit POP5